MRISISNKIVKKYYSPHTEKQFNNEIFWLKKLKKYGFVPKIINIDYKNLILSISYEGKEISAKNKPNNWSKQLDKILNILKKNNCFHSDINPQNILVRSNKLKLIDFDQCTKITDLKKNIFLKTRIFYDEYSHNRVNLSINKNMISSNDLRILVVWDPKKVITIEKKINQNRNIFIIDKTKIKKGFYHSLYKDRIYWIDQFYNKDVGKNTNKLKNDIHVYILKSINPVFKSHKMMFTDERKLVDDKIFKFKKKIRNNKTSIVHIADNFEESKRNALFLSKSKYNYPAKYFFKSQNIYKNKNEFFQKLNKFKKLKYVIMRDQSSEHDDIDIMVNDYFLFKRISDCHSYKLKNLDLISNSGDPIDEDGFKVSNYIYAGNKKINIDVRFVGDGYLDKNWQKKILQNRKFKDFKFIPSKEDYAYTLVYHIVFHKGYIANKYKNFLEKYFKLKILNLEILNKIINEYMSIKNYRYIRPSDLTMPVVFKFNKFKILEEFKLIKKQIKNRNFSGSNKMLFNILKFQDFLTYFNIMMIYLFFLNQFKLFKSIFKKYFFKFIRIHN